MALPKLLLDTNILIGLEDDKKTELSLAQLSQLANKHGIGLHIHEVQRKDVDRDNNTRRKAITLSKLEKFAKIEGIPEHTDDELTLRYGAIRNDNDRVDCELLHAIDVSNAADFLVSEDNGLHRRADSAGLSHRVFRVADAVSWLTQAYEPQDVTLPSIASGRCYQIAGTEAIFDTLKSDYPGFPAWFEKCQKEHRACWSASHDGVIVGIGIVKPEEPGDVPFQTTRRSILKLCTFKIEDTSGGQKLGEQLLKQVLWHAARNDYEQVYVTVLPKHEFLIHFFESYGFAQSGIFDGEVVLAKSFELNADEQNGLTAAETSTRTYPNFIEGDGVNKYVIPVHAEFHAKLFPESTPLVPLPLVEASDGPDWGPSGATVLASGHSIRKVYVCNTNTRSMRAGDIAMFYMTRAPGYVQSQMLTNIGMIDDVTIVHDLDTLMRVTAKRTVYSATELENIFNASSGGVVAISFLHCGQLEPALELDILLKQGILYGAPQSVTMIDSEQYNALRSLSHPVF